MLIISLLLQSKWLKWIFDSHSSDHNQNFYNTSASALSLSTSRFLTYYYDNDSNAADNNIDTATTISTARILRRGIQYHSELSNSQLKTFAILPKITSFISIIATIWVLAEVARSKLKRSSSYHRLLAGVSFSALIRALSLFASTWPMPMHNNHDEYDSVFGNIGTTQTCQIQGFFIQVGIASPIYFAAISIYYCLTIRHGWSEQKIKSSKVELLMHVLPWLVGIITGIIGIIKNLYNPSHLYCWIAPLPEGCNRMHPSDYEWLRENQHDSYDQEALHALHSNNSNNIMSCKRGEYANVYRLTMYFTPLWICFLIVLYCLGSVYFGIRKEELRTLKFRQPQLFLNDIHETPTQQQIRLQRSLQKASASTSSTTFKRSPSISHIERSLNKRNTNEPTFRDNIQQTCHDIDCCCRASMWCIQAFMDGLNTDLDGRTQPQRTQSTTSQVSHSSIGGISPSSSPSGRGGIRRGEGALLLRRESSLGKQSKSRQVASQAMWYLVVFFLSHVFGTMHWIEEMYQHASVTIIILQAIMEPLQGLFDFCVYRRPTFIRLQREDPNMSLCVAMVKTCYWPGIEEYLNQRSQRRREQRLRSMLQQSTGTRMSKFTRKSHLRGTMCSQFLPPPPLVPNLKKEEQKEEEKQKQQQQPTQQKLSSQQPQHSKLEQVRIDPEFEIALDPMSLASSLSSASAAAASTVSKKRVSFESQRRSSVGSQRRSSVSSQRRSSVSSQRRSSAGSQLRSSLASQRRASAGSSNRRTSVETAKRVSFDASALGSAAASVAQRRVSYDSSSSPQASKRFSFGSSISTFSSAKRHSFNSSESPMSAQNSPRRPSILEEPQMLSSSSLSLGGSRRQLVTSSSMSSLGSINEEPNVTNLPSPPTSPTSQIGAVGVFLSGSGKRRSLGSIVNAFVKNHSGKSSIFGVSMQNIPEDAALEDVDHNDVVNDYNDDDDDNNNDNTHHYYCDEEIAAALHQNFKNMNNIDNNNDDDKHNDQELQECLERDRQLELLAELGVIEGVDDWVAPTFRDQFILPPRYLIASQVGDGDRECRTEEFDTACNGVIVPVVPKNSSNSNNVTCNIMSSAKSAYTV